MGLGQSIAAIASFDTKGHIKPVRVRINGEAYVIESSLEIENVMNMHVFDCVIIDGNYRKHQRIVYKGNDNTWYLEA